MLVALIKKVFSLVETGLGLMDSLALGKHCRAGQQENWQD